MRLRAISDLLIENTDDYEVVWVGKALAVIKLGSSNSYVLCYTVKPGEEAPENYKRAFKISENLIAYSMGIGDSSLVERAKFVEKMFSK